MDQTTCSNINFRKSILESLFIHAINKPCPFLNSSLKTFEYTNESEGRWLTIESYVIFL